MFCRQTAQVRFRGRGPEYWLPLLTLYYIIEKQREALLWSFLIARNDPDNSSIYSHAERQALFADLQAKRDGDLLRFRSPIRQFTNSQMYRDTMQNAGSSLPNFTEYIWSSANAYPYVSGEGGNHVYPDYQHDSRPDYCTISVDECFGRADFFDEDMHEEMDAMKTFGNIAFEHLKCGDCIMAGLLAASGDKGFEAFLPPVSNNQPDPYLTQSVVPELGGWNKSWQDLDYSRLRALETPYGEWDARDFCVRLIQRYSFAFGK